MVSAFTFDEEHTEPKEGLHSNDDDDNNELDSIEDEDLFIDNPFEKDDEIFSSEEIGDVNAAVQDLAAEQSASAPALEDWKDLPLEFVSVSCGQATEDTWLQAQDEIGCARNGFEKFFDTQEPSLSALVGFFFGEESELFRSVKDELAWSFDEWNSFLQTFCVQSAYKISVTNLFNTDGYIKLEGLMAEDEYILKWKQMGTVCLPDDERAGPAIVETFWMKMETAINSMLRRFVIEPWIDADDAKRVDVVEIVFDDNKMWFDARVSNAHLNIVQHVRDNRRGPVHHDAVASATGQIAGFRFERKKDNSISSMKSITKQQFIPAQGGTELRNLNFLSIKGDRAYTLKEGMFGFMLPSGARIRGTKQRRKDFPFCYGTDLKDGDKRTDIPLSGAKSMWVKSVNVSGRVLYAVAYRNGNGGVTLGVSTQPEDVYHWDVTLKNPADRSWFFDLSDGKVSPLVAIRPLRATRKTDLITEDLANLLLAKPICPLTMGQRFDHGWWICRMFSFGSSGSYRGFKCFDGTEDELQHHSSWNIAKSYLSKAGERSWNKVKQEKIEPKVEEESSPRSDSIGSEQRQLVDEQNVFLPIDVERLVTDDEYAFLLADTLDPSDVDNDYVIEEETFRSALLQGGATLSKAADDDKRYAADKKKFVEWCRQHTLLRPLFLKKTAARLKQLARTLSPPCPLADENATATSIYNTIKAHLAANPTASVLSTESNYDESSNADLSKRQKLLGALFSAAFLKKQSGEEREYTRTGLDMEKPLARKLLEDSNKGRTAGFVVEEIASVPVVERTGLPFPSAIASTDFCCSAIPPGGEKQLVLIETKDRVKEGTATKEQITQGIARLRSQSSKGLVDRNCKHFAIKANDPCFAYFVASSKEALQILHQAFCYDVTWVLLLIGDAYGRIIAGIWVEFDNVLKSAWKDVLDDMNRLSVGFLYEDLDKPFVVSEDQCHLIEPVLSLIKVSGGPLDMHSFKQMVMIWRVIRLTWPKPLPEISKLLPYIFSSWNAAKGGSDVITKMIWSAMYSFPNRLPQAHAIARMILLLFIQTHRSNHISTSKLSLPYKSLLHYRNAANKRSSLHSSLIAISRCFEEARNTQSTPTPPEETAAIIADSPKKKEPKVVGRKLRGSKPKLCVETTAVPVTGSTPQRSVKAKLDGLLKGETSPKKNQQLVIDRVSECTGVMVSGIRGTCCVCMNTTNWYCLCCHVNVCLNDLSKATNTENFDCFEFEITIPALEGSGAKQKHCKSVPNKCFIEHHRQAIFRTLGVTTK